MWSLLILLCIFASVLVLVLVYYYKQYHYNFRSLLKLPGLPKSKSHFFLGNLSYFGTNIVENFEALISIPVKYGPIVRVYFGPYLRAVVLTDPRIIEFFLGSSEHITKSPGYDGFKIWLGNGLVNSAGDHWKKHRKIITPTFHFQILDKFTSYIKSNSEHLIQKLQENVGKNYDIYPIINLYALDVICDTAMNIKINAIDNGNTQYVTAVKTFLEIHILRFYSFILQNDFLFKFTNKYREQQEAIGVLKGFTEEVIKQRREERRQKNNVKRANNDDDDDDDDGVGSKKRIAFLDLLLDLEEEGQALTDEEIREEVDTFMFAGHDTVSSTISFSLFLLAQYPEVQERIFEESVEILGDVKSERLTLRNVANLKYLDMTVKECMRIYSPVPFIERQLMKEVQHDGVIYPKDTILTLIPYAMSRNPELFPEPLKFDPNRFSAENIAKRHPYAYIPFSAGPRNCIGQKFALLETKATIVKIIRNFKLTSVKPAHELQIGNDAVLKSMNGIPIVLNLRT